jgi:hypothetical protein
MIQTMLARASGSSKESRLSQSVAMMLSYLTAITAAPFNIQLASTGILNASSWRVCGFIMVQKEPAISRSQLAWTTYGTLMAKKEVVQLAILEAQESVRLRNMPCKKTRQNSHLYFTP